MRRLVPIGIALMLAGVVFSGLAGTWDVGEADNSIAAALTGRMKTHCIGRFLIDLPEEAQVALGQTTIDGFNIAAFVETPEEFHKRLADREAEIRAKPDRLGGYKNLESERQVMSGRGLVGKIFVHGRTVNEGTAAKGLELVRYRREGVALEALVHGAGISIDIGADRYDPDQIWRLPQLVAQLVLNPDNRIPSEPGFCFDRAYVLDPLTADQGEQITMFGGLPKHTDVQFMLTLGAGLKPDSQGVLERSDASTSERSLWQKMYITKLRAAPKEIAGLPGEELVRTFVEEDNARVHSFWWEVNGTEDNVLIPHFVFKMNTGKSNNGPVPSSLTERAALGLWDRILSSIRLRPSARAHVGAGKQMPATPK